jgi:dTMP kinase
MSASSPSLAGPPAFARGKFITFEGLDGAGKTTHLAWFRDRLAKRAEAAGASVAVTREPGGTPLGEALREILLHQPMHLETEALLMFAARREHIARVIEPALARGDWVLSDRFTDATFAYQGGGRGLSLDKLTTLESWVHNGLQPDLTVLFDLPPDTAGARRGAARAPDRFESESAGFFARTRAEYLRRAAEAPRRFAVIDSTLSRDEVRQRLAQVVANI